MKYNAITNPTARITTFALLVLGAGAGALGATEPCDDFGECKALIEINATDGDIGFHFLMDGDALQAAQINDPNGTKVFEDKAKGPLSEQTLTETFAESDEPLCWEDPEADEDEEIVTLEEFLDRWTPGTYFFTGRSEGGEMSSGQTQLTFNLPAAPDDVDFDGSVISWEAGDTLGNCADFDDLTALFMAGVLPQHPIDVPVAAWEVVLEPDVEDGELTESGALIGSLEFNVRVAGDTALKQVTVPADYLASLPADTPVKIEVGAIGVDDNATFSEEGDFCINEDEGCEDED